MHAGAGSWCSPAKKAPPPSYFLARPRVAWKLLAHRGNPIHFLSFSPSSTHSIRESGLGNTYAPSPPTHTKEGREWGSGGIARGPSIGKRWRHAKAFPKRNCSFPRALLSAHDMCTPKAVAVSQSVVSRAMFLAVETHACDPQQILV